MSKLPQPPVEEVGDPEVPPSVQDALGIIQRQQQVAAAQIEPNARLLYGVWGLAWLLGFGAFYLIVDAIIVAPLWVAGAVFSALLAAAGAISGIHIARRVQGVRGTDSITGKMYGFAWLLSMVGLGAFLGGAVDLGIAPPAQAALFAGAFPFLVGVLYLAGGAIWRDRFQYGMGVWIILAAAASPFVGVPANYLVLAFGGGGGLLAAAGYFAATQQTASAPALRAPRNRS
jgi:hypothetical protein